MNIWKNREWGPMLLKEISKPFESDDYIYEIKFDGIRANVFVNNNKIQILSRNRKDITHLFPELASIKELIDTNTIFDGEIVVIDDHKPSFAKLQERNHLKDKFKIDKASKLTPVIFVAFDILYLGNTSLIDLPLKERKSILDKIPDNDYFIKSTVYYHSGTKLFNTIVKYDLEGIVAKKIDSPYEINRRSASWLKIKNYKIDFFLIGGYEIKKNGYLSVLLGEKRDGKLYYVGNATLTKKSPLYLKVVSSKVVKKSSFVDYKKEVIYIASKIECRVVFQERTPNNHLRLPIIK